MMKMVIRVFPFFVLSLLLHSIAGAIPIPPTSPASRNSSLTGDCEALFHFSNSFTILRQASRRCGAYGTTSYPKTASWKNGTDCCLWDGVTCRTGSDDVIGLDLGCSWLQGPLHSSSSLFSLGNLRWLNLASNDFNGSHIPSRFGIFRGMEHLNLSSAGFSGPIPLGMTSHLSRLVSLDLSSHSKYFQTIEDGSFMWHLRNLTRLRELVLDFVDMARVSPISLTNLPSTLTSLSLRNCFLRGLFPIDIFHLPNLHSLYLSSNRDLMGTLPQTNWSAPLVSLDLQDSRFNGLIPASLGNLTSMNYLDLSENEFTGAVPPELGNLHQLTYLDLGFNNLSGSIDFEMFSRQNYLEHLSLTPNNLNVLLQSNGNCSFPRLKSLVMHNCNLTKFPYFLSSSPDLESVFLLRNSIRGVIPEWFGKVGMDKMTELVLSSNDLTGEIPSSICLLSSLEILYLSNNRLYGTIPECLGNLSGLLMLHLGNNLFQGPLPQSLANCTSLTRLNVSYNGIYDTFPRWLYTTDILDTVDLQSNQFHGVIEAPLPPQFSVLSLSNNNFSGKLPTSFLLNSNMYLIDIAYNNFDGPPPFPPPSLEYYSIPNNKFTGEIPRQICGATWLRFIDVSSNRLTGSIPRCFRNLKLSLSVLNLRANKFVGHIPDIFVPKNVLKTIRLSQNQLRGALPRSLKYCESLEVLDLSENELEDSFPDWLGALPNLQVLVLRSNKFRGSVGSSSKDGRPFQKMRIFDLSGNKFYGPLPAKYISKLRAMKNEEKGGFQYMGGEDNFNYFQESVTVVMKGVEVELVKILTLFTTIDFSCNFFEGEIPEVIGSLKGLKGLNFSHNNLSGNIPSSVGNLTNLEWMDLSSNRLQGKIPRGLADIAWLECLNLSSNQLVGPIPQSTQFDTFNQYSFGGNPGLCGHPLPKACGNDGSQSQPSLSLEEDEEETESGSWIEWKAVPMGYGCGLAFGISVGYIMLETRRPRCLARVVERKLLKITSKTKKDVASRIRIRTNIGRQ